MKLGRFYKLVVLATASLCAQLALAFELSPKKAGVALRAAPAADAAILKTLQGSERLKVVSKSGLYWVVTLEGQKGFVLASEVQPARNGGNSEVSTGFKSVIQGNSKDNPGQKRTRNAVMGIRGLDDAEEVTNKNIDRNDPNATQKMENRNISKENINKLEESVSKEAEQINKK